MPTYGEVLAKWFQKARIDKGLTLEKTAELLGVSAEEVEAWESHQYRIPHSLGPKIIDLFGPLPEDLSRAFPSFQKSQIAQNLSPIWAPRAPQNPPVLSPIEIKQEEAVVQVAQADATNIQEVAASQLAIINSYYQSGLEQSQQSFRWSLIWGGIGFAFLLIAVGGLLLRQPSEVAYASGLGGVVVEVFAAIYLYLYKHASDQLATFRSSLEETQRLLLANSMCAKLSGDLEQNSRAEMIRLIVTAAVQAKALTPPQEKKN